MYSSQGILFLRNENEEFKWFEHGDEDKDGKPWNVKGYDKEGNIIGKWVNGVKQ